jgi:CoA:oxalate CoA-transferase
LSPARRTFYSWRDTFPGEDRMSFDKPYEGLRVVDLSQGVAGPYCAMLLARQGADVIKVEPLEGDWSRSLGPRYGDHTAYSVANNIGKRSLAVDLKNRDGKAIVDQLAKSADVFLEGFRPGVIDRLGFGYERLRAINPGLIYVSISGFSQKGPMRDKPAMDSILQAFTGFMSENSGPDGIPHRTPTVLIDMSTGLYAQQAVATALYARAIGATKAGIAGRRIDVSLLEAAANLQSIRLMSAYREGAYKAGAAPGGTYRTRDGWIQVGAVKNHEFQGLCKALGLGELAHDPRFATNTDRLNEAAYLVKKVGDALATKSNAEWRAILTEAGLQNECLQTYREFVDHPHTQAIGLIGWTVQAGSEVPWASPNPPGVPALDPVSPEALAPRRGEHTHAILQELNYPLTEIARLISQRVVDGPIEGGS